MSVFSIKVRSAMSVLTLFKNVRMYALLYFGNIKNFLNEMILTNYCSRIPVLLPTFLPDLLIMLFKYLFSISGGLMILNSMPCYGLDGYLVLEHLLESMYGINERIRKMFLIVVTSLTTFLVGLNLLIGIVMTSWHRRA